MGTFGKCLFNLLIKEEHMDLANADNKRVIEMYKGGVKVWELPTIMTNYFEVKAGDQSISLTTYPASCQVTITVNDVVYKKTTNGFGSIVFTLNEALKSGDSVDILIEKDGWKAYKKYEKIY